MTVTTAPAWQLAWRFLAAFLLALFVSIPGTGRAAEAGRPNILFLLGDDLTSDELGCYGGKYARTPAIDRLAAQGYLFENSFVTTSICACSRASILAGQHQRTTGIKDFVTPFSPESLAQTYPLLLKAAGYRIGFMGKWGIAASLAEMKHPASQFDFWRGLPGQAGYWYGDEGFLFKHAGSGKQPFPEALHEADQFPKDVEAFLAGCPADRPWCLSISFKSVHPPRAPHPSVAERFTGDQLPPLPASCTQAAYATVPEHVRRSYNGRDARRDTSWLESLGEVGLRQGYGHYLRSVETLDLTIARIVAVLEARGVAGNTVIILHGDNGTLNGQKGLIGKWVMYEPSIRVPTIVVDPRQPADRRGGRVKSMALSIDLAPTMLDVGGVSKPEGMQGESLLPLLGNPAAAWRKDWFYEHTYAGTPDNPIAKSEGVRSERWKYIRWLDPKPNVEELFDLENDPDELKNLVADPAHRTTLEDLRSRYQHWRKVLPDRKPDPDEYAGAAPPAVRPASTRPSVPLACPPIFGDHMVLQCDQPLPVWGTAPADASVRVTFAGQSKTATAASDGRWQVTLDPLPASAEPHDIVVVAGDATLTVRDVLIGEVWLCSGQSNMVWQVNRSVGPDAIKKRATDPLLRVAYMRGDPQSPLAATTHPSRWFVATPEVIGDFSAVAATFGSDLRRELDVPVGLVLAATAGSPVETWLSREAVLAHGDLNDIVETSDQRWAEFQAAQAKHVEGVREWRQAHGGRVPTEEEQQAAGIPPRGRLDGPIVAQHFDPGIAPLIPFQFRGVIWYQGESNVSNAERYETLLTTLIADWRSRWGRGARPDAPEAVDAFPFFIVQISNFGRPAKAPVESRHAIVREAQQRVANSVPNAGLATAIDGDGDIHPKDKAKIGGRLARLALAKAYGRETEWSGPAYEASRRDGTAMVLSFARCAGGLAAADGKPLAQFGIAGNDRAFHPATATIEGDTLRVSSPAVAEPTAVRYAWADNPVGANLVNAAGLPAAPFRTDNWPLTEIDGSVGEGPSRAGDSVTGLTEVKQ